MGRLLLAISFILQSCAVVMKVPISRFDTPEVTGQIGRFRVGAGLGSVMEMQMTDDYTVTPPDPVSPSLDWKESVGFINSIRIQCGRKW